MSEAPGSVDARDPIATEDRFALELPTDPASVRTARLFAAAIARTFGVDEDIVEDVKLAISEACTNAVKAHQRADVAEVVQVRALAMSRLLSFEVIDAGPGFTPPPEDETKTPPQGLYEGSLGLTLIRSLFGEVQITRNADRGMTVRFSVDVEPGKDLDA